MPSPPNLLSSRPGRLAGFFCLYLSEGLPQGFTTVAVALEFKRMGMTGKDIGLFAATIMLPWAWKWLMGPLVDNFHLRRFGRRKQWILFTQAGMLLTLLAALPFFPRISSDGSVVGLALFSGLLLAHNVFAASQDVAIDALACSTLAEHERGVANGLMFAGAQAGAAIGGSGVIYLKGVLGFPAASLLVPLLLCNVMALVLFLIREPVPAPPPPAEKPARAPAFAHTLRKTASYLAVVLRVFFLTRRGFLGLLLAVIPFGGMALSLTVSSVLTPTLGMRDTEIAHLGLVCSLVFTVCCMTGGFLSDRYGRRLTLAVFSAGTLLPTLWMGWKLHTAGWTYPTDPLPGGIWPRHEALISAWWAASLAYSVFQGLMYGIRTAFYMDIVEPRIAATHFTACMALLNVVTIYSHAWQGKAVTAVAQQGWGMTYLQVFLLDAALGALFLLILPFVKPAAKPPGNPSHPG